MQNYLFGLLVYRIEPLLTLKNTTRRLEYYLHVKICF